MDVVSLLRKAGKTVKDLHMFVSGEISKQQPIEYVAIHLRYDFTGDEDAREAALHAVKDSQEKYCGISSMLKKIIPVTWEVRYNGVSVFTNESRDQVAA